MSSKLHLMLGLAALVLAAFVLATLIALAHMVIREPEPAYNGEYAFRQRKLAECASDPRCADYNVRTGVWSWKAGQQPAPQPVIIKLENK